MARLSGVESVDSPSASHDDIQDSPPFFNTTFSTHRVSPLHVGAEDLTDARLDSISLRLRDTLVGDVVRGVQVGIQATETPVGQVGPLKTVRIQWFQPRAILGDVDDQVASKNGSGTGLWIDIRHENASYAGLLLPGVNMSETGTQQNKSQDGFLRLPLLLLRMPLPLKNIIADWLASTFDCRVSRLTMGTKTILGVWETWIETVGLRDNGPDLTLSIAFNTPLPPANSAVDEGVDDDPAQGTAPGLKSVDITISPQDLRRFARAGADLRPQKAKSSDPWENDLAERRRLAGGSSDDGWAWRANKDAKAHPFTEALGRYLDRHLALNLFHPSVRITQISCSGFVLGQNRLKIVKVGDLSDDLSRAAWAFVEQLGGRIQGEQPPQPFSAKFSG